MFVFKAAVVGAGTMGGEIAQAIAAADIPVVLKDVDQKFVDVGLQKAREVTEGQVARLVEKEKITADQGREQVEAVVGRITGTTSYDGFGDVDFVIEASTSSTRRRSCRCWRSSSARRPTPRRSRRR
jgi:3-hydroxyacyl-CoA dehydrogenase